MKGEIATIQLHLFLNGMYVECEDTDDGEFIPIGNMKPLCDFINKVQEECDPDATYSLTEKGLRMLNQEEKDS